MDNSILFTIIGAVASIIGAIASVVAVIVAIVISRRIPEKYVLSHRQHVREAARKLYSQMKGNSRNHKLRIIDVDRFDKYYPEVFSHRGVQPCLYGELDNTDIKGIKIVDGLIDVKQSITNSAEFVVSKDNDAIKAIRVGLIPYSWIVDIDPDGDECEPSAIIYCRFKKHYPIALRHYICPDTNQGFKRKFGFVKRRSPYQSFKYYIDSKDIRGKTPVIPCEIHVKGDNPVYP